MSPAKSSAVLSQAKCPAASRCNCATAGRAPSEKRNCPSFLTDPADWETVVRKFQSLSEPHTTQSQREQIVAAVHKLEEVPVSELTDHLRGITAAPLDQEEGAVLYGA